MLPQQTQTPYMPPAGEHRPEMQPPMAQRQVGPEYNEQFIETLAQRLMPRLMPEIMYQLREVEPARSRNKAFGMSLALAIVSLALMIPLTAIVLGMMTTLGGGVASALIGIGVIGLVMVLINVMFNYMLFYAKV
jgi:hypothetical protein